MTDKEKVEQQAKITNAFDSSLKKAFQEFRKTPSGSNFCILRARMVEYQEAKQRLSDAKFRLKKNYPVFI